VSLDSQICVRLPARLAEALRENAELRGVDRSDVVREALRLYLEGAPTDERPWDRIGPLAGAATGGPPDLAARSREHLKAILGGG
jgi:Arc/MetJ-type ribon-helix-helix transcriptional regulator